MLNKVIFREYDIRGVYQKDFDEAFAKDLGKAHTAYVAQKLNVKNPLITIGHDARLSSPSLAQALIEGITESGGDVLFLGLVTTPISYFSTFQIEGVNGAIMVTGSHNPPEYNGFKISVGKGTIFGEEIQNLRKIIEKATFLSGKGSVKDYDIFPSYVERYKKEFGQISNVNVVFDCGNGAAGAILNRLITAIGIKPNILFEQPDGRFPNHHPDPTVEENLEALKKQVSASKAMLGIGFDGDADRIGVVDNNGRYIFGDELMTIISRDILKTKPGQKIIGDVKCSDRLYDDIKKHGGVPIMWKTGHSLVKEKIKIEKSPFGGELSGHIFFADRNYGYDDALYAALRVIEIISKTGKTLDQLLEGFPPAFSTPEIRIDTTEEKKVSIVKHLCEIYKSDTDRYKVNFIDGVRISFKDGWALIRASNTQPVLVMRFESTSQKGLDAIRNEIEGISNPLL